MVALLIYNNFQMRLTVRVLQQWFSMWDHGTTGGLLGNFRGPQQKGILLIFTINSSVNTLHGRIYNILVMGLMYFLQ